ncbi:bifunctional glutamate N-acetyltransferase/amino-acid acetyltransferase ArgJ [Methylococcus capsulatus]|jgi:glutamate N-acetyltransferase/amino-acid N-acetyltransferase|uniref:bifunctional glutamate N-acetyltransferase/amino-acid acetyltransferase ArgJ n=1 Tax=Methylococcus capsulatus TaxID=414 RepID=UPI001C52FEE1|nr:bifunctional glutamate N-acetyltransferase/amino-acid acetyltransferase ArgJ [Methylococcus capsulatus]QXP87660.1 bifunctional glutamate N-acetyltransferase/amino-acid acetyltransferase ArgJ [Methylococcus capsulatus]QXP90987.1 bifunctional glutamate N-acetyltransferase/amino-acid acetyltransferase ArgJ [Methylococcus capsulatus]QXP92601.1 bifunctional glutamate N-acetyltransferase/amino-acid acetyltransferase ArgJ [Methylococcus capsulatus]UQN12676.1 bifunctional glutamate N-acetyltransfera
MAASPEDRNLSDIRLCPVAGIRLGTAAAAIKHVGRDDVLLIEMAEGSACAAVFTQNAFCAAPVTVAREHLRQAPRWLLVNSGNANAGTGTRGLADARASCEAVAALVGGRADRVMPFSTGVIGEYLPLDKIRAALPKAFEALSEDGWEAAARAIMTTDTRPKKAVRRIEIAGRPVVVSGIAKGAGMIHPNMATMLAFVATDARIGAGLLQSVLEQAVNRSFNCITVDGDTSTNDACVLMASQRSEAPLIEPGSAHVEAFQSAVDAVLAELAEAIVRDGEGATKFIRILVEEAASEDEARLVGKTIAHSPLVKTAFFASDPNWGRILAAVGRAGCKDLDISRVAIWLDEVRIVAAGARDREYTEARGITVMRRPEITVRVSLGRGQASARVMTCDLSLDYVRINAEYRT